MLTVVADPEVTPSVPTSSVSLIDELVRDGARRMLAAALEAEVCAYIAAHTGEVDEHGRRLVVRNGHAVPGEDRCVVVERPAAVRTEPVPGGWHEQVRLTDVEYRDGWRPVRRG